MIEKAAETTPYTEAAQMYSEQGFAVVKLYNEAQIQRLDIFARDWLYKLLFQWTRGKKAEFLLERYHLWSQSSGVAHTKIFEAHNRHTVPGAEIEAALINPNLKKFLAHIGIQQFRLWNEGLGWLAFRFIRPGVGDGYPFSKKAWGPAKNVISVWAPIIGHSSHETLTVVPRSHLLEQEKYLPKDSKFRKDEYRLLHPPKKSECYNPSLRNGEVIVYHPHLLHSEDVISSEVTRLNLEFRCEPFISEPA